MALEGYDPYSHIAVIAYARDGLFLSDSRVSKLDRFRRLRNNIQYRTEEPGVQETEGIVEFMRKFVTEMEENLRQRT